jgi:hypothetical protein
VDSIINLLKVLQSNTFNRATAYVSQKLAGNPKIIASQGSQLNEYMVQKSIFNLLYSKNIKKIMVVNRCDLEVWDPTIQ